ASLSTGACDIAGNALPTTHTFSFVTGLGLSARFPPQTAVSPVCLEGSYWHDGEVPPAITATSGATASAQAVLLGPKDYYVDVDLVPGTNVATVNQHDDPIKSLAGTIQWISTDLAGLSSSNDEFLVRTGDSLLLTVTDGRTRPAVPDDDTVALYHFETPGEAKDSSDNANHGVLVGDAHTVSNGRFGAALELDGNRDSVDVPGSPSLDLGAGDFTIEAWINPAAVDGQRDIVAKEGAQELSYVLQIRDGRLWFLLSGNGKKPWQLHGQTLIRVGEWQHVAAVRTGNSVRLYVDGVEDAARMFNGSLHSGDAPLRIGAEAAGHASRPQHPCMCRQHGGRMEHRAGCRDKWHARLQHCFAGLLDEVRISSCDRSDTWGSGIAIDANGDTEIDFIGTPGEAFAAVYSEPGEYVAQGLLDGVVCGEATIVAVAVDLSRPIACQIGFRRGQNVPIEPAARASSVHFSAGDASLLGDVDVVAQTDDGARVRLRALASGVPVLVARIGGDTGPIAACREVDEFELYVSSAYAIKPVPAEGGGTEINEYVSMTPHIGGKNLTMTLTMRSPGITFENGLSAIDVDVDNFVQPADGSSRFDYTAYAAPEHGAYCMDVEVHQHYSPEEDAGEALGNNGDTCTCDLSVNTLGGGSLPSSFPSGGSFLFEVKWNQCRLCSDGYTITWAGSYRSPNGQTDMSLGSRTAHGDFSSGYTMGPPGAYTFVFTARCHQGPCRGDTETFTITAYPVGGGGGGGGGGGVPPIPQPDPDVEWVPPETIEQWEPADRAYGFGDGPPYWGNLEIPIWLVLSGEQDSYWRGKVDIDAVGDSHEEGGETTLFWQYGPFSPDEPFVGLLTGPASVGGDDESDAGDDDAGDDDGDGENDELWHQHLTTRAFFTGRPTDPAAYGFKTLTIDLVDYEDNVFDTRTATANVVYLEFEEEDGTRVEILQPTPAGILDEIASTEADYDGLRFRVVIWDWAQEDEDALTAHVAEGPEGEARTVELSLPKADGETVKFVSTKWIIGYDGELSDGTEDYFADRDMILMRARSQVWAQYGTIMRCASVVRVEFVDLDGNDLRFVPTIDAQLLNDHAAATQAFAGAGALPRPETSIKPFLVDVALGGPLDLLQLDSIEMTLTDEYTGRQQTLALYETPHPDSRVFECTVGGSWPRVHRLLLTAIPMDTTDLPEEASVTYEQEVDGIATTWQCSLARSTTSPFTYCSHKISVVVDWPSNGSPENLVIRDLTVDGQYYAQAALTADPGLPGTFRNATGTISVEIVEHIDRGDLQRDSLAIRITHEEFGIGSEPLDLVETAASSGEYVVATAAGGGAAGDGAVPFPEAAAFRVRYY
ncbi:MAG: LamG domain-containing protein, partial [Coriobacteriia bacterium]|nr:LamG domain-containing protein [Coriobacteriia bacterium]